MSTPAIDNSGKSKLRRLSFILKICVFATGCAAMVTEYTLATLASYLLGDSIRQWTIVISLMLFSMGLGSRYSRKFEAQLLDRFVLIEFGLSFLCTFSAMFCFWISAYTNEFRACDLCGCLHDRVPDRTRDSVDHTDQSVL